MVKPLSQQLADLSVRAKSAEDAVAAAKKEAHDKVVARREQAHAAATAAIQKVDRDIKSAGDDVVANWNGLKAKVSADLDAWNAKIAQFKHDRGVKRVGWSGRQLSQSTMRPRRSNRQNQLFSMPSLAASRRMRPGDPNSKVLGADFISWPS